MSKRELTDAENALVEAIGEGFRTMEAFFDRLPKSREASLAKTKLEESIMWAARGLSK